MFKTNDTVVYGTEGVCKIDCIIQRKFRDELLDYYVLKPLLGNSSIIYVPTNNELLTNKIHHLLSSNEIIHIINSMPETNTIWIEDDSERREEYKKIIQSGEREGLIKLIKTLLLHKKKRESDNKKLLTSDDQYLKKAEHLLYSEFAYVLDIDPDDVPKFIKEQIKS